MLPQWGNWGKFSWEWFRLAPLRAPESWCPICYVHKSAHLKSAHQVSSPQVSAFLMRPSHLIMQEHSNLLLWESLTNPGSSSRSPGPLHDGRKGGMWAALMHAQNWAWAPAILFLQLALWSVSGFAPSSHILTLVFSGLFFFFWLLLLAYAPLLGSPSVDLFRRSNMKGTMNDGTYSPDYSLASVDLKSFKNNLVDIIQQNKERWKELAAQGIVVYEALLLSLSVLTLPLGFRIFSP